jgi:hypothetical protein
MLTFEKLTLVIEICELKLSNYRNFFLSQYWALVKFSGTIQTFGEIW